MNVATVLGGAFLMAFGCLFAFGGPKVAAYRYRHPEATIWPQPEPMPPPPNAWFFRAAGAVFVVGGLFFLVSALS